MEASEEDLKALRRMVPARKIEVMRALIRQAYELKAAGLRERWPNLSEEEIQARARALVGGDGP